MNSILITGRLCADPELRQTQSGVSVCQFRVAVNRRFANKQTGEREADFVSRYFRKGGWIELSGELRNNDYTDQNGTKHHSMVVHCGNVGFVGNKDGAQSTQSAPPSGHTASPQSAPAHTYQRDVAQQTPMQLGDLSDFEEILSDGETPF